MKIEREELTATRLRELVTYDSDTGIVRRRISTSSNARCGDAVGSNHRSGYLRTQIGGTSYLVHRLAWLYVHGEWPNGEIDHINGDPMDNRISNLRLATRFEQNRNTGTRSNNACGVKGVYFDKRKGHWCAQIRAHGKCKFLGYFPSIADASAAYRTAASDLFGEFARF